MGVWIWLFGAVVLLILWEVDPTSATRLVLAGLAALGGWLLFRSGRRLMRARRRLSVVLSSDQLLVGQPFSLRVGPSADRPAGAQAVTARLICRESASFRRRGRRQSATEVQDWVVQQVEATVEPGLGSVELELAIPLDSMHSFRSRHHGIGWRVEVETGRRRGRSPDRAELPLTVLPAVHQP
jgi:hypothetical protein